MISLFIIFVGTINSQDSTRFEFYNPQTQSFEFDHWDTDLLVKYLDEVESLRSEVLDYYEREKFIEEDKNKIELQDKVIEEQKNKIANVNARYEVLKGLYQRSLIVTDSADDSISDLKKQLRKEKRKNTFMEILSAVLTITSVVLGIRAAF